ncbi:MAG TPA: hypothetical protein VES00_14760 [Burkholderiaceae bacterium]|jgi:protein TonB|nr:hypothetical protein [Burkholderiaceae bacterium]
MSGAQLPFLATLEVDATQDPDERTLRRAYARKLKQIDIENEPERFQALREALEQGLRWIAWRDQQRIAAASRAPDPAPAPTAEPLPELAPRPAPPPQPPAAPALPRGDAIDPVSPADGPRVRPLPDAGQAPQAPPAAPRATRGTAPPLAAPAAPAPAPRAAAARAPEPKPPDADDVAAAVFARFQRRIGDGLKDDEAARALLLRFLGDPGLASIDARSAFEASVARLLAGNWKPGHQHLFDPAIEVFGWNSDHARLKHFGQVGVLLTAAIRERATVRAFSPAQLAALATLLERIRSDAPPDPGLLTQEVPQLQFLVERIPNWLRIVSPVGPVNQRFEMWSKLPPAAQRPPQAAPQPQFMRKKGSAGMPAGIAMLVLAALGGLSHLGSTGPGPSAPGVARPRPVTHARAPSPADDADLARRQKEAESLLARIRQTGGGIR